MNWPAMRLTRTARYIAASTAAGRSTINNGGSKQKQAFFNLLRHYGYLKFWGDLEDFSPQGDRISRKCCIFVADLRKIIKNDTIMEATKTRKTSRRRKQLSPEERKAINAAKPAGNKYVEAARRHQGEVWVKDPMLML